MQADQMRSHCSKTLAGTCSACPSSHHSIPRLINPEKLASETLRSPESPTGKPKSNGRLLQHLNTSPPEKIHLGQSSKLGSYSQVLVAVTSPLARAELSQALQDTVHLFTLLMPLCLFALQHEHRIR